MIDRALSIVRRRSPQIIGSHTQPVGPAKERFYRTEKSRHLTVVFGFWHTSQGETRLLVKVAKRLNARGSDVLLFDLDPGILHQQPRLVRGSFENLASEASARVGDLLKEYHYASVDLLGLSLGNVPLCMTAQQLQSFHSATLVVPGSDFALSFWNGISTRQLRDALVVEGVTLDSLRHEWQDLSPASYAEVFRHHQVTVYIARGDKVVPYEYGLEFVAALEKQGVQPRVHTSRLAGHGLTVVNYIRAL